MNLLDLEIIKGKKSPFINYVYFGSLLEPEDNGNQTHEKSFTNKCQKYVLAFTAIN